ncbi:MAG: D-glycero-alpha-D-manno-heptose-1,7-bisphosphate 7-phosphatase [Cryomorphaceae bacterium]|nr:MAG: D-glycero-alpha-D-manno-heptose-1,7-bisphosphate 7-phosphatase [Cryomorphaceae bacterium]
MHKLDTLFLDRDGVINVKLDGQYVKNPDDFEFMIGAKAAISKLSKIFNRILIVTNQQGIEKGIMSDNDLCVLHEYMLFELKKNGGVVDKIYYCPHLAAENCNCRKPNPGMIQQALIDFPDIKVEDSYLIGDSDTDIIAGSKMGLITVKVDNEYTLSKWCDELLSVIQ